MRDEIEDGPAAEHDGEDAEGPAAGKLSRSLPAVSVQLDPSFKAPAS